MSDAQPKVIRQVDNDDVLWKITVQWINDNRQSERYIVVEDDALEMEEVLAFANAQEWTFFRGRLSPENPGPHEFIVVAVEDLSLLRTLRVE